MAQPFTVPASLVGLPPATLQQWLTQSQQALQSLYAGQKTVSATYTQGDGSRSVTYYTLKDETALLQRCQQLSQALRLTPRRRAIGVMF